MKRALPILTSVILGLSACSESYATSSETPGFVTDPDKCEATWLALLNEERKMVLDEEGYWSEMVVLNGDLGGDIELAGKYMAAKGWFGVARPPDQRDGKELYFLPNREPLGSMPAADLAEGLLVPCTAAWISGVPFTKVIRRFSGGRPGDAGIAYKVEAR